MPELRGHARPALARRRALDLSRARVSTSSTLYVPPVGAAAPALPPSEATRRRGSLTLAGTGYRVAGHATPETQEAIESADRLFYLVTDPATGAWLDATNPRAESLHGAYVEGESGAAACNRMVDRMLAALGSGADVCAAFYGHPAVGLSATHRTARRARQAGFSARFLPAVSFEDCLFADVGLDPGDDGRFLYDADDFLRRTPVVDTTSALVLLQAGAVGLTRYRSGSEPAREGVTQLGRALSKIYGADHEAVIYEAADFPMCEPMVERVRLADLAASAITIRSTVYVPQLAPAARNEAIAERLAAVSAGRRPRRDRRGDAGRSTRTRSRRG